MKRLFYFILLPVVLFLSGAEAQMRRLTIATDAELFASSGEILSREEQERMALERMIRERLAMREQQEGREQVALSMQRSANQIKPGNPINVRVIDPDQCVSAQPDKISVRVEAASGDVIDAFPLKETGPHTGVFEGKVPTEKGIAVAYATDTEEGRDPVFPISAGSYPPWVARPDNIRPKSYTVDLYDNVAPGVMRVSADVPGRGIKSFILLSSMDGTRFRSMGSYPERFQAWDGGPRVEAARYNMARNMPRSVEEISDYLEFGFAISGQTLAYGTHNGFKVKWDNGAGGLAGKMNLERSGEGSWYVARFSGGFYLDDRMSRTFELVPAKEADESLRYFFLINGEPPAERDSLSISRVFSRGVHTIEVYVVAQRDSAPAFEIRQDIPEPPYMAVCPADMFDVASNPLISEELSESPAVINANEDKTQFDVTFDPNSRMRIFRLTMLDFETDAPAISRIVLVDREKNRILPTKQDLPSLRDNAVLEIVPGDRVTITYEDPVVVSKGREVHEANLTATFHNAVVSASFVEIDYDNRGQRIERYIPMKRFEPGDAITVFIQDPDEDVSPQPDKVKVAVGTRMGKAKIIEALETDSHSGVFTSRIFPVSTAPARSEDIQVKSGDDLVITYLDRENTNPGIPWRRTFVTEQVWYQEPELRLYDVFSQEIAEDQVATPTASAEEVVAEQFPDQRDIVIRRPDTPAGYGETNNVLIGAPVIAEVVFPTIAKSPVSRTTVFMQTRSGRQKAGLGEPAAGTFDISVPGTISREATPGNVGRIDLPPGYRRALTVSSVRLGDPLQDGRFTFTVPVELADIPEEPLIGSTTIDGGLPPLSVRGDDVVYVGFRYSNESGQTNWLTHQVALISDVFFDIMDRRYQEVMENAYVGETLYLRVVDPQQDTSDEQDSLSVRMVTSSGASQDIDLTETMPHSGIFRGHVKLRYAETEGNQEDQTVDPYSFPVKYGDKILAGYRPKSGGDILRRRVSVYKGADGDVLPFTKRFKDPEIAVQTQFTMAEAFFELAKRHRKMGQEELARKEIAQGRRLLDEALRDFPETEKRVQADYLLANLAFEFGKDAVNEDIRRRYFLDALDQFGNIVSKFPDSVYAPRSQYKKGLVYEEMGEIELAAEEYVSLSYRYPDNELIAETIARLGQFFLTSGRQLQETAEANDDAIQREKEMMEARETYLNAARVFSRLRERFPTHSLALRTTVLAGQSYMRAESFADAIEAFEPVVNMQAEGADQAELIAEAMFWTGEAYMKRAGAGDMMSAYQVYKRLTWDYPASKWARFARGRLASAELSRIQD